MSNILAVVCSFVALILVFASAQITTGNCVSSLDQLSVSQAASIQGCLTQSFLPTGDQCVERCMAFAIDQAGPSSFCAPGTTSPAQLCQSTCESFASDCGVSIDCSGFSTDVSICIDVPKSSISAVISGLTAESEDSDVEEFSLSTENDSAASSDSDPEEESDHPPGGPHGRRPRPPQSDSDEDESLSQEESEEESDRPPRGPHGRRPRTSNEEPASQEESEEESDRPPIGPHGRRPRPPQSDSDEDESLSQEESEEESDRPPRGPHGRPNNGRPNSNGRPNNGRPNDHSNGQPNRPQEVQLSDQQVEQPAPQKHRFFDKFRHNSASSSFASLGLVAALALIALGF